MMHSLTIFSSSLILTHPPTPPSIPENSAMGRSVEMLEHVREKGYEFIEGACQGAAEGGHLGVLKWCRSQNPPCPWSEWTCTYAAEKGRLEILKWARDQDPPCPWSRRLCKGLAAEYDLFRDALFHKSALSAANWAGDSGAVTYRHQHIIDWIDQREDESDYIESSESD